MIFSQRMFNGYREQNGLKRLLVEATMAAREAQLAADRAEEKWRVERKAMLKVRN
jgi:hypothetical protein